MTQTSEYQGELTRRYECQNCGRRKDGPLWAGSLVSWERHYTYWGGKYVCSECEWKLRKGMILKFDFDINIIRSRLQSMSLLKNHELDDLAYDIETIYSEYGWRRHSRDADIVKWVKNTKVYKELFTFEERANADLVDTMTNIWSIVLGGIKG